MNVKKQIKTIGWSALALCCIVLLVAAMEAKDSKACKNIEISIEGAGQYKFITHADVDALLRQSEIHAGETLDDINLKNTEDLLKQNVWIKDAEMFFDNHQVLHVNISQREPLARVFTVNGNSFYIDSTGLRLPANENATARITAFTSFPSDLPAGRHDKKLLSKPDSLVLKDVTRLAKHIAADSFMNNQTAQVNITRQGTYEIIPVIGDQVIRIGTADDLDEKFIKLRAFYKQVWSKTGFERYGVIDVQYEGQVVAIKRGRYHVVSDTSGALKQMAKADIKLKKVLNDTVYAAPLSRPVVIDEEDKDAADENLSDKKPKAVMKKKS